MPDAAIDARCLIDVLAAGHAESILRASGFAWHLPRAVQGEVHYLRQHDPAQPGQLMKVPADLSGLLAAGVLTVCDPENQQELDRFTRYAALFRSDGEAMCLAIAEQRAWVAATDDRKAIRVAQQAGLAVVCCPGLVKAWADATGPDQATLNKVLQEIQVLAQFKPSPSMPEYRWWVDQLARANP
ncbi:MAG TPA: hypothetical protein VG013_22590 [Gemmataceae bacterium]|nr:hypothetical protein [Gemmataceae bacterium]